MTDRSLPEPTEPLVPVALLTGFLGSGKTTLLNRLLKDPASAATAVIVNELGEIGLDQVLIERAAAEAVLLGNGCLCCTVKGDLGSTLNGLVLQRAQGEIPAFRRVVIETTGLADPAPILHVLMTDALVAAHYKLGGVVTTVDAVNGNPTLDRYAEAVKQVAVADRLVLTKTDLAARDHSDALCRRLQNLNPGASILDVCAHPLAPVELWNAGLYNPETKTLDVQRWLEAEAYVQCAHAHAPGMAGDDPSHVHERHDHGIESFAIVLDEPIRWEAFSVWLEMLTLRRGADPLRVKGIVAIAERPGRPIVLHGVQQIFHPPVELDAWPSDDHRTRLVFITRNIDRAAIEQTLRLFAGI